MLALNGYGLTPEVSRPAKRFRLGRIVSAVEGEAMEILDDPRYRAAAKRINEGFASVNRAEVIPLLELCRELARNAERYRWLREHFRFANDSMRELWFDPALEPDDAGLPVDLDQGIDAAMNGANT